MARRKPKAGAPKTYPKQKLNPFAPKTKKTA
jgi:hypothetical protein